MFQTRLRIITLLSLLAIGPLIARPTYAQGYDQGLVAAQNGDYEQAFHAWLPLAQQGNAQAQFDLGVLYDFGRHVPQDRTRAATWFRMAATQGHVDAQYNLAVILSMGDMALQDHGEAVKWYRAAAKQGMAKAQYNLGVAYASGRGVEQDLDQAVSWYRKAATQGEAGAQFNLGVMAYYGHGIAQDNIEAYKWFEIALSAGYQRAIEAKNMLVNQMSLTDIAKAKKQANICIARQYEGC